MRLQLYFLFTISCAMEFMLTYAFRPLLSFAKSKTLRGRVQGIYRTVSGLFPNFPSGQISRSASTFALNMAAVFPTGKPTHSLNDYVSWLIGSNPKPSYGHQQTYTYSKPSQSADADMAKFLSHNTHVAGFMDYDPKLAARSMHKKKAHGTGRISKWFDM